MRMLIALILLTSVCLYGSSTSLPPDQSHFLIFSNDGTFYKLDPKEQHVHWHSELGEKLISFQLSETETHIQNELSTYFIPTIQGHFVYIAKNKEILVHRSQIQPLLNICFGKSSESKDLMLSFQQQYFLHQKYEYFFIDLHNGKLWDIQNFFRQKIIVKQGRHALIKVSKKFLKQLKSNLQVKWSVISSTIDIMSAAEFLKDPKAPMTNQEVQAPGYEFRRISNNELQVVEVETEKIFQMGGTSPIMAVFSYQKNSSLFQKHPISYFKKPILAIQDKKDTLLSKGKNQIAKAEGDVFPHTNEYKDSNKSQKKFGEFEFNSNDRFDFEYCLNTFRAIQQLSSEAHISTNIPFVKQKLEIGQRYQKQEQNNQQYYNSLPPTQQISPTSHPHLFYEPQRSKEQPLIWIFIIGSLIASGGIFYKLKVGKLLTQLQKLETYHDKRFQEIQKKLGQFEQMQKMYEVYWDKLLYRKPRRKSSEVLQVEVESQPQNGTDRIRPNEIEFYEHLVFEGRFLNKEALVYAVPMDGIDLIHVQHQLNDLLSCSHKSLVKLYYYTKNSQFLLIFCEKIEPLWQSIQSSFFFSKFQPKEEQKVFKSIENITNLKNAQTQTVDSPLKVEQKSKQTKPRKISPGEINKKFGSLIKEIIQCTDYLDSKIQIFSLPLESIILNERCLLNSEKQLEKPSSTSSFEIELKINTIPSILQVYKHEQDNSEEARLKSKHNMNTKLRHDLVKVFYSINSKGQKITIKSIYSMIGKEENNDDESFFVRDFYDFVLNENYNMNIEIINGEKSDVKEEEKKATRVIGTNHEFLFQLGCHPFLWDSKRKMLFLADFSNYIETYLDDYKLKKLESYARDYQIIDTPWTKHLDISFVREVNQFRKYDFNSVRDLIRLIRNKVNHFHEIPKQTRNSIGKTPEAFIEYMLKLYPKLLSFAFVYAKRKKWKLHVQIK